MKITRHNFSFAPTVVDGYEVTFRVVQPTESTNPRMRSVCFRVATKLWLLKSGAHRAYYVMHSGQKLRKEDKTNLPLWQKSWERTSEASRRRVHVPLAPSVRPSDPCASCESLPMVVLMPRRSGRPDGRRTKSGDIISCCCRSETPFHIVL